MVLLVYFREFYQSTNMRYIAFIFLFLILLANNAPAQNSILPQPRHIEQRSGFLDLTAGIRIEKHGRALTNEQQLAQKIFKEWAISIQDESERKVPQIQLVLEKKAAIDQSDESYHLQIHKEGIKITAASPVGIFY